MLVYFSLFISCQQSDEKLSTEQETPTYYADIQPVLSQQCVRCHGGNGLGTGDLGDVDVVLSLANLMLSNMESGLMPPPTSDPECRPYVGFDHLTVTESFKDTFRLWVDAGKPLGDVSLATEITPVQSELQEPDLSVSMPEPFMPTFEREDESNNEYRCFILDTTELEEKYITAVGVQVGVPEIMHHITLSTVNKSDVDEEYLDPQGWDCIDSPITFASESIFAGFGPGSMPLVLPEDTGILLSSEQTLVLSMHYVWNAEVDGATDQTFFDFKVEETVEKPVIMASLGVDGFSIPPGSINYSDSMSIPAAFVGEFTIYGSLPHMHQLGREYDFRVLHSDGSESCVVSGDYSFDNQLNYIFETPLSVTDSDLLFTECTWDNPTDESIEFGERTDEEMCIFFTLVGAPI